MWKLISLLFCIASISNILHASADEVELPQGSKIAVKIFEKLHAAHEVAINQKVQEDLYLSLPLSAPNRSESVTVANTNASISPLENRIRKVRTAAAEPSLDRRANECDGELWQEGQDPCEGREKDPRFKACLPACQFTRDVSRSGTALVMSRANVSFLVVRQQYGSETVEQSMLVLHKWPFRYCPTICRSAQRAVLKPTHDHLGKSQANFKRTFLIWIYNMDDFDA